MWSLLIIGILAALATAFWLRGKSAPAQQRWFAGILVAMQTIYLGFVLIQPSARGLGVEAAGLVLFVALAAGGRRAAWWLPVGYLLHGLWDLRHGALVTAYVPSGYPELCVAYDWFLAGYFLTRLGAWSRS